MSRAVLLAGLLAVAVPAAAQDQLLVGGRFIGAVGHFGSILGPGPRVAGDDVFGGGRFAVQRLAPLASGEAAVAVVDAHSGAWRSFVGGFIAVDRARPVVFVVRGTPGTGLGPLSVWAVDVTTGNARRLFGASSLYDECAHAYSANVLFCAAHRDDGQADITVVDVATGTTRVVTVAPLTTGILGHRSWRPLATPDGHWLYFDYLTSTIADALPMRFDFARLDTASGHVTRYPALDGRPFWDDTHERLITATGAADYSGGWVSIYSKEVSPIVYRAALPAVPLIQTSPHTGRMYVVASTGPLNGPARERIWVLDSVTFSTLATPVDRLREQVRGAPPDSFEVALLTAPGPPRAIDAVVSGRSVRLTWTNVGAAANFAIDIGLGPGRTDLQTRVGPEPSVTFAGVPPGVYFVRLRGGNAFGGGRPSQEIRVVVP